MRPAQKGGAGPPGAWLHVRFTLCTHAPRAKWVEQAGRVGGDNRGDPVTVQENPPCPCDRIVTPVLAVTIASMRVTTP